MTITYDDFKKVKIKVEQVEIKVQKVKIKVKKVKHQVDVDYGPFSKIKQKVEYRL